jgi:RNA polymerase sigma-70 factor (ECF subfamily)
MQETKPRNTSLLMTPSLPVKEADLIRDLKAGRSSAYTLLYDRYAPALFGMLLRVVKDEDRAQDLLQDAFVKSWLNIHRYDPEQGRLFTWLFTLTRRLAYDELKGHQVRLSADSSLMENSSESYYSTEHEGLLANSLIKHLEPKHREVIELVYYRDYTRQEVADELALPLGTVKTRCRGALQHLRQVLRHDIRSYHACC